MNGDVWHTVTCDELESDTLEVLSAHDDDMKAIFLTVTHDDGDGCPNDLGGISILSREKADALIEALQRARDVAFPETTTG